MGKYFLSPCDYKKIVAFNICSLDVRGVDCRKCLHVAQCKRSGSPASPLANYLTRLYFDELPEVENLLNSLSLKNLKLTAHVPVFGTEKRVYVVICCRTTQSPIKRVFRINLEKPLTQDELTHDVIAAYYSALEKGKI